MLHTIIQYLLNNVVVVVCFFVFFFWWDNDDMKRHVKTITHFLSTYELWNQNFIFYWTSKWVCGYWAVEKKPKEKDWKYIEYARKCVADWPKRKEAASFSSRSTTLLHTWSAYLAGGKNSKPKWSSSEFYQCTFVYAKYAKRVQIRPKKKVKKR